ncbi:MAG TPA: VanZ family protein [Terracidiphilus sp.]|nr:VanZ family protein [Terracidiphilus sp.]
MVAETPRQPKQHSWLYAWLPVLLGTALIAVSSSSYFSAQDTSGPFRWVYEHIFGRVSNDHWGRIHFLLRKCCHFFGYAAFGLLWLRGWWLSLPRTRFLQDAALAVLGAGIVASGDEFHQHFLPSRTGSPWDVLLDCSGALTVQLIVYIYLRIFRPKQLDRAG